MVWMALFGVWPLAEPSHWEWSTLTLVDWVLHSLGTVWCWLWIRGWYYRNADRTLAELLRRA